LFNEKLLNPGNNWRSKLDNMGWVKLMETSVNYSGTQEELKIIHGTQG
jgi:hypothetical protein